MIFYDCHERCEDGTPCTLQPGHGGAMHAGGNPLHWWTRDGKRVDFRALNAAAATVVPPPRRRMVHRSTHHEHAEVLIGDAHVPISQTCAAKGCLPVTTPTATVVPLTTDDPDGPIDLDAAWEAIADAQEAYEAAEITDGPIDLPAGEA